MRRTLDKKVSDLGRDIADLTKMCGASEAREKALKAEHVRTCLSILVDTALPNRSMLCSYVSTCNCILSVNLCRRKPRKRLTTCEARLKS